MVLELKPEKLNKLDELCSNEWRRKRPYIPRPNKIKITSEQVKIVKHLLNAGLPMVAIQTITKLSEYHVLGVRRGKYNFLLE